MGIKIRASHTARVEMIDGKEAVDERFEFMALPKKVPYVCETDWESAPQKSCLHIIIGSFDTI